MYVLFMNVFLPEIVKSADIEVLVDDFLTFYLAGMSVVYTLVHIHVVLLVIRSGDNRQLTGICSHSVTPAS